VRFSGPATMVETAGPGTAGVLASEAAAEGAEVIIAAGGDGTLNEVLQGVMGTDAALGLIPLGTGNDFARALTGYGTLEDAVATALAGTPKAIDVGRWSCAGGQGYFINIAGCGFDAAVAERINCGFRYLRGTSAYIAAVAQSLASYRAAEIRLLVDDEEFSERIMLCAVANATSYGGGMRVAPEAELDDGLFDIVTVREISRTGFLRAFPSVFKGAHLTHPKVSLRRGSVVSIEGERSLPVLADGEVVGKTPVRFELLPRAVRFMMR
jgi:diacylglycerol kinase (ATP)